jgi:hypothetical protein
MGQSGQRRLRNSGLSNENFRVIFADFGFIKLKARCCNMSQHISLRRLAISLLNFWGLSGNFHPNYALKIVNGRQGRFRSILSHRTDFRFHISHMPSLNQRNISSDNSQLNEECKCFERFLLSFQYSSEFESVVTDQKVNFLRVRSPEVRVIWTAARAIGNTTYRVSHIKCSTGESHD